MSKARKGLAILGLASAMAFAGPHSRRTAGSLSAAASGTDVDEDITSGVIDSGDVDGEDTGWKIFGGYMFNRHFGVELAYIDLGEVSYSGTFSGFPVTGGKVELSAFTVSALGVLPHQRAVLRVRQGRTVQVGSGVFRYHRRRAVLWR